MKKIKTLKKTLVGLGAIAAAGATAEASVNVQTRTVPGNSHFSLNENASVGTGPTAMGGNLFFAADYNFLNDPLVELNPGRTRRTQTLVDGIQTLDLTAGYKVAEPCSVNFTLPLNLVNQNGTGQTFAVGDSRLFAKIEVLGGNAPFQFSLIPEVRLPTGSSQYFLTDGSTGVGISGAIEKDFKFFRAVANLGYRYSGKAIFREMDYRQRMPMSLGVSVPVNARWAINAEAGGERIMPLNPYQNPAEFYAGARYQVNPHVFLTGGASMGSTNDVASDDYRLLFGLKWEPSFRRTIAQAKPARSPVKAGEAGVLESIPLALTQEIRFQHDSARLLPSAKAALDEIAMLIQASLKQNPGVKHLIEIDGHTNELGSDQYNLGLSRRRAASVFMYLTGKGLSPEVFETNGYGERRPKAGADVARKIRLVVNRRVEFKVVEPKPRQLAGEAGREEAPHEYLHEPSAEE